MKVNQLKGGSLLSYLQILVQIVIGIVYTPIMIRLLGQSEYGLYNIVSSTISTLTVLSLGFNSGYILKFAQYKKKNDQDSIHKLNGLFLMIFSVIGLIALICGLFLSFNLELVFDQGLTAEEYRIAQILMLLLTFNLTLSFPMSVFSCIISAHEKFIFLKLLGTCKSILSPLLSLPLLMMGYGSIAMVTVSVALALVTDCLYVCYTLLKLKCRFRFRDFENGLFKSLFGFTFFVALNLIVDQINSNLGKIILGRYCGTTVVAIYSVGFSLFTYYKLLSTSISGVFTPRIHKIINSTNDVQMQQRRELTDLFSRIGRIQFILLALASSGFAFFGRAFIQLWVGDGYEDAYWVGLLLMISSIAPLIQNVGIEIQRAMNKHQFRSIAYFIMAIINVVLSAILCQQFGAVGSAIGTAISFLLANGLLINIYYHLKCNVDVLHFWKDILLLARGLILPVAFGVVFQHFFRPSGYGMLLLGIFGYCLIYLVSMWFFGFNKYEKSLAVNAFRVILPKNSRRRLK